MTCDALTCSSINTTTNCNDYFELSAPRVCPPHGGEHGQRMRALNELPSCGCRAAVCLLHLKLEVRLAAAQSASETSSEDRTR